MGPIASNRRVGLSAFCARNSGADHPRVWSRRLARGCDDVHPARGSGQEPAIHDVAVALRALVLILLATGLLALGSFTENAAARPDCDVPNPPPICNRGEDPPDPRPDP